MNNNTIERLYAIYCFDNFDYQYDAELVLLFTDMGKASRAIKDNTYDFQRGAYKFCKLVSLDTDYYIPFTNEPLNIFYRPSPICAYYKFVLEDPKNIEKDCCYTGNWVQMTPEEVSEQEKCDSGFASYIFAAHVQYKKDKEAGQLKSYAEILKLMKQK